MATGYFTWPARAGRGLCKQADRQDVDSIHSMIIGRDVMSISAFP
jgi:hypothetical protein